MSVHPSRTTYRRPEVLAYHHSREVRFSSTPSFQTGERQGKGTDKDEARKTLGTDRTVSRQDEGGPLDPRVNQSDSNGSGQGRYRVICRYPSDDAATTGDPRSGRRSRVGGRMFLVR